MNFLFRVSVLPTLLTIPLAAATWSGTVTDPTGKPVPHARVIAVARDAGQRVTVFTNEAGQYRVEWLAAGDYLVQADAGGLAVTAARPLTIGADAAHLDLTLGLSGVHTEIVVTATGAAQASDEVAKSVDTLPAAGLDRRALLSATEALRFTPGTRVQTLGGPGAFTRIMTRGLRPQDTAITIDGLRFRDAATTQGDATPFLENLFLVDSERIEVLRGTGSSIYGSNAIGGVVNMVTNTGGGPLHGELRAEGGGLGMMRGVARMSGGTRTGLVNYSVGLQHLNVLRGVDGDDRYRNQTVQGMVQVRPRNDTWLTARFWGANSFAQINSTPYAAPTSQLPARGVITATPLSLDAQRRLEAGQTFSYGSATIVPALNDPDSRRSSWFGSGALTLAQRVNGRLSYRLSYQRLITERIFNDGPAGVRLPASFSVSDRIRGGTDTVSARADVQVTRWNTLTGGYEFERESYRSRHLEFAAAPLAQPYFTAAGQYDHSVFFSNQARFLRDRLQIGVSGRLQGFALRDPEFEGGTSRYQGLSFQAPPRAKTGDVSAAWFVPSTGTKLRAHTGNGYRSPSIYERFGASFYNGSFSAMGDPRLRPERTVATDAGIDQYLLGQKLRLSASWFYTNLQETIAFDSSGFLVAALDPFRRASGYINTGGGVARGVEASAEAKPFRSLDVKAAYTYTNADTRRSTVRDKDFFGMPYVSPQQFSVTATQRITARLDAGGDLWIASASPAIFSNRAFLFAGPRKLDLIANYTVPVSDRLRARWYAKVSNVLASDYLEAGYRTPGRWGIAGVSVSF